MTQLCIGCTCYHAWSFANWQVFAGAAANLRSHMCVDGFGASKKGWEKAAL